MAEALAALIVPSVFKLSRTALLFAWEQLDTLTEYKLQCKLLVERCQALLIAICDQMKHDETLISSMRDHLHVLENVCISVRDLIFRISNKPFAWRLLHQDDIARSLSISRAKLHDAFIIFNMNARIDSQRLNIDCQRLQAELSAFMAKASAHDHAELLKQVDHLSQNDHRILGALEGSHIRLEELLVALTKHVQNMAAPPATPTDKFIKNAVGALQRVSKEQFPIDIAHWQVTSLEVAFNRDDTASRIGHGSFGNVFRGKWQGEESISIVVAVKEMYADDAQGWDRTFIKAAKSEINIWLRLLHPRIIPFYGACLEAERPFIVSRFCAHGNIIDYLKLNPQADRLEFVRQISCGMAYLHSQSIIHADLKGANILVAEDHKALISDFGLSQMKDRASITTHSRTGIAVLKGTLRWMPPELLEGDAINFSADVYSFGITAWELYTLEVPFSDVPERAFFRWIIDKKQRPVCPSTMTDDLKGLVHEWWDHDAHKRPKFKAISATLDRLISNDSGFEKLYQANGFETPNFRDHSLLSASSDITRKIQLSESAQIPKTQHDLDLNASKEVASEGFAAPTQPLAVANAISAVTVLEKPTVAINTVAGAPKHGKPTGSIFHGDDNVTLKDDSHSHHDANTANTYNSETIVESPKGISDYDHPDHTQVAVDSSPKYPASGDSGIEVQERSLNRHHSISTHPNQANQIERQDTNTRPFWRFRRPTRNPERQPTSLMQHSSRSLNILRNTSQSLEELSTEDIIIAVIGPTGSGKSSFISNVTGGNDGHGVGHGLETCTTQISSVKILPLEPGTRGVIFIDTPGFDDTNKSDGEIMNMISDWMEKTYKREMILNGILYFHRISDNRMAGTPLKNLRNFEKLCGKDACQNIVFTTTMWDEVELSIGEKREKEIEENYLRGMIDRGSRIARYRNSRESAWSVIQTFFENDDKRQVKLLQNELFDLGMHLRETSVGQTLFIKMDALVKKQQSTLQKLRTENNEESFNALVAELTELKGQLDNTAAEVETLKLASGERFTGLLNRGFFIPRREIT